MAGVEITLTLPIGQADALRHEAKQEQRSMEQQAYFWLVRGMRFSGVLHEGEVSLQVRGPGFSRLTLTGDRAALPSLWEALEGLAVGQPPPARQEAV